MAKRMSDDDVMNFVYGKLFGDLDGIESHTLFDEDGEHAVEGTAPNAGPATHASGGVEISIKPLMAGAVEGGKPEDDEEDEDEDKLKGIGGMSPLMAQLHGDR